MLLRWHLLHMYTLRIKYRKLIAGILKMVKQEDCMSQYTCIIGATYSVQLILSYG
jgi:hypothetical protein